jgi:hypothetical protein
LVNLTCGRNPWKQACPSDETFRAYLSNPDFLQSILPVSKQCNELLKRIFALNPASRISIKELKYEVSRITNWTMSLEELRYATRATKEAARAWAPAYILDDPRDAPPAKPVQTAAPHHHQQQQPQQVAQPRPVQPTQQYYQQQHAAPARHQATPAPVQAKPRQVRETVFDITDSSTVSSVDSLAEWKAHQAHLQQQQQAARRQHHASGKLQSPYIPSPVTSPSVSSAACPEFPAPVVPSPAALAKGRFQQQAQQSHVRAPAHNTRSDFSLSDSEESSMDEDDMEYAGGRSPLYHSSNTRATHHHAPQQYQTRHSPNPNITYGTRPTHYDYATRSKNSPPPPLAPTQAPRTPRQAFTTAAAAANRQRKQSIESNSSSSSISSDASWTGLPPTPDTPVFAKRHAAMIATAKGNGSPSPMQHLQPQEKPSMLSALTSPIAIAGAKLKMAF